MPTRLTTFTVWLQAIPLKISLNIYERRIRVIFPGYPPFGNCCFQFGRLCLSFSSILHRLTQLLVLLKVMASMNREAGAGEELHEAAALLQQQLVYNGQVLDAALDGLHMYKDGTQLLNFLRSSVHLAYALILFMLSPYFVALLLACSYL